MKPKKTSNILRIINQATSRGRQQLQDAAILKPKRKLSKKAKIIIGILALVFVVSTLIVVATTIPIYQLKNQIQSVSVTAKDTIAALKSQNLPLAQTKLQDLHGQLNSLKTTYNYLAWYRFTPLKEYYLDGTRLLSAADSGISAGQRSISSLEPYADVLGFAGEGSFTGGTAQDRILKIIETLKDVSPELEVILADLTNVQTQLHQINPDRYPYQFQDYQLDNLIVQGQELSTKAVETVSGLKPLLEVLPAIAGLEDEKKYLMIFQNDAEIRPTGGFMTAYGVVRVEKGTIHQEKSDDIYELDQKFNSRITPPAILKEKLKMFYWNLRDMNFSPDFKVSMDQFLGHYLKVPGEPDDIDGIIAVDTQVLSRLISVLGPIDVPGYGTYTAEIDPRCDCPQVIYALEDISTRPVAYVRDDRKAFLVPMMQTLILKAYGAPQQAWPSLFEVILQSIQEKHVLFYMLDESAQTALESAGFAGRVKDTNNDYFMVVDANLGGGKANLFITQSVEDNITVSPDGTSHSVTITYDNPAPASNCDPEAGKLCLNPAYMGYVRIYLPQGSQINQTLGFDDGSEAVSEDLGKSVVEGFFRFQPQSRAKIKIDYRSNYQPTDEYQLFIQKQPGQKQPHYTITFNNQEKQELDLTQDKLVTFDLK